MNLIRKIIRQEINKLFESRVERSDRVELYRDENIVVVIPLSHAALKKYATNCSWCINSDREEWKEYFEGVSVLIIQRHKKLPSIPENEIFFLTKLENGRSSFDDLKDFDLYYNSKEEALERFKYLTSNINNFDLSVALFIPDDHYTIWDSNDNEITQFGYSLSDIPNVNQNIIDIIKTNYQKYKEKNLQYFGVDRLRETIKEEIDRLFENDKITIKKINSFFTDEGKFSVYDFENTDVAKNRPDIFTVWESENGWIIRNAFVPNDLQQKGIATKFYIKMNQESLKNTGKPLNSTQSRKLTTGEIVHELSSDGIALWDSLVKKGYAEKIGEKNYRFKSKSSKLFEDNSIDDFYNNDEILNNLSKFEFGGESNPKKILKGILINLKNILKKPNIILYRVVWIKDVNLINQKDLGEHFVQDTEDFHEEMLDYLYNNASEKDKTLSEDDAYLIKIIAPTNKIDIKNTIHTNIMHPFESEIMLKDGKNLKILEISPFYE